MNNNVSKKQQQSGQLPSNQLSSLDDQEQSIESVVQDIADNI